MNAESHALVFRFQSDLDLVMYEKKLMPLCAFLRILAVEKGMVDVAVESHSVTQRFHHVPG